MNALIKYSTYLIHILLALYFTIAGTEKLVGAQMSHIPFSIMGTPDWFVYFIGGCELLGALGLLVAQTRRIATIVLIMIVLGSIYYHLTYGISFAVPEVTLLSFLIITIVISGPKNTVRVQQKAD